MQTQQGRHFLLNGFLGKGIHLAHLPELAVTLLHQLAGGYAAGLRQMLVDGILQAGRRLARVIVRPAGRFRHHLIHNAQLLAIPGREHQRLRRLPRQIPLPRGAAHGVVQRYGRINGVLLHQNPVRQTQGQRRLVPRFADDHRRQRRARVQHQRQAARNGVAHALLLRLQPRIGALRIDQRNQRQVETGGQGDDPLRLPQALRVAVIAPALPVPGVPALLPDGRHRMPPQQANSAHYGAVIAGHPVAANLKKLIQNVPDIVERIGPFLVSSRFQRFPGLRILHRRRRQPGHRAAAQPDALRRHQQPQQPADALPQPFPVHHIVQQPPAQVMLGGVGVRRRRPSAGLNHRADGRKPDHGTRLGDDDVRQVGETGVSLPGGRIGEHGDKRRGRRPQAVDRRHRFRHLHQRQHAFLGARPAPGDQRHHRQAAPRRQLKGQRHLFPHNAAHAAAHKAVIQHYQHQTPPVNLANAGDGGFGQPGAILAFRQLLVILRRRPPAGCGPGAVPPPAAAGKRQRRHRANITVLLPKTAPVGQQLNPLPRRQRVVKTAVGADAVLHIGRRVADGFVAEQAMVVPCRQVHLL